MRKLTAFLILASFFAACNSGSSSKPVKVDTVFMVDVTDTVRANVTYRKSLSSDVVYYTPGYALVRGYKTMKDKQPVWASQPQLVGALDSSRKALDPKTVISVQ